MLARHLRLVDNNPPPEPAMLDTTAAPRLRIAIATQDRKNLNAHFGSAKAFVVYDVTPTASTFLEAFMFDDVSDESGAHKTEGDDRITPKVEALTGCTLMFVRAIGGPAAARVVKAGIHPVKIPDPMAIDAVIAKVQSMMTGNPPPWLRKVMQTAGAAQKAAFDDED
jgi:nitrogen fixation protein NifX